MKALYIDCCIRGEQSRTRKLAEAFLAALPQEWQVTRLDLMREGLQPLMPDTLASRDETAARGELGWELLWPRRDKLPRYLTLLCAVLR